MAMISYTSNSYLNKCVQLLGLAYWLTKGLRSSLIWQSSGVPACNSGSTPDCLCSRVDAASQTDLSHRPLGAVQASSARWAAMAQQLPKVEDVVALLQDAATSNIKSFKAQSRSNSICRAVETKDLLGLGAQLQMTRPLDNRAAA